VKATIAQIRAAGGYSIIYADPAWSYQDRGCNGAAEKHYPTMGQRELARLPVAQIAADNAVMFLWVTNPLLEDCLAVGRAWGFQYKTKAFEWVKSRGASEFFGLGRWTRGNTESCLLFVRGKKPPRPIDNSIRQLVFSESPWDDYITETVADTIRHHSAKPPAVRERIVQLLGDLPRVELFARDRAEGWDSWGNEVNSDISLEVPSDAA